MNSRILSVIAVLVGFGLLSYLVLDRMGRIEDRLGDVGAEVREVGERAETAATAAAAARENAESALSQAQTAEQSARESALGRQAAEDDAARAAVAASVADQEARRTRTELDRIQAERDAEIDRLREILGELVDTRRTASGLVMNLGSDSIEFGFDEAALGSTERELLSRIAGVLLTAQGFSVFVYGHTDDVGTEAYNQTLSERRAAAVRDYLVGAGIDPAIIEAEGFGKSSPRIEGASAEARAQNRRVEIGIVDVRMNPVEVR